MPHFVFASLRLCLTRSLHCASLRLCLTRSLHCTSLLFASQWCRTAGQGIAQHCLLLNLSRSLYSRVRRSKVYSWGTANDGRLGIDKDKFRSLDISTPACLSLPLPGSRCLYRCLALAVSTAAWLSLSLPLPGSRCLWRCPALAVSIPAWLFRTVSRYLCRSLPQCLRVTHYLHDSASLLVVSESLSLGLTFLFSMIRCADPHNNSISHVTLAGGRHLNGSKTSQRESLKSLRGIFNPSHGRPQARCMSGANAMGCQICPRRCKCPLKCMGCPCVLTSPPPIASGWPFLLEATNYGWLTTRRWSMMQIARVPGQYT